MTKSHTRKKDTLLSARRQTERERDSHMSTHTHRSCCTVDTASIRGWLCDHSSVYVYVCVLPHSACINKQCVSDCVMS